MCVAIALPQYQIITVNVVNGQFLTRSVGPVVDGAYRGPAAAAPEAGLCVGRESLLVVAADFGHDVLLLQDVDEVRDEVVRLESLELQ